MSPDELRALAEALRKMRWHLMSIDDACDLEHAADYLLACADEQPVMQFVESQGAYTFEFLRSLTIKPGDLFYLHPAPAVPQPADRCRSSETPSSKATSAASPERQALNLEDAAAQVAAGSGEQAEPKREPRVKPTHEAADAFWRYWHEQAEPQCRCRACLALLAEPVVEFTVCPQCGNKRCPKADDHRNACTGSNEPGQVAQAADRGLRANLLQRDREQLERTNRLLRESLADVIKLLDHAPPRTPADDEIIRRATRALTLGSLL